MDISAKVELKERRRRERVRWNAEIILLLPSLEHYHGVEYPTTNPTT